jgi:hypothetical protein
VPVLEWRTDVGDERYLNGLSRLLLADTPVRDGAGETLALPNSG